MQESTIKPTNYRKKREIVFTFLTVITLILPFIRIGDAQNHIFLLSFDHKVLHIMGVEYSVQEFYSMPFLLMILFIGVLFMTTVAGRLWCGWYCPQTIFRTIYRDLIQTKFLGLRKKISNKQAELKLDSMDKKIKYIFGLFLFTCIALAASANLLFFFVPPEDFFAYAKDFGDHQVLLGFWLCIAFALVFDVCFVAEKFCIYMCPYARIQSVFFDNNTLLSVYDVKRGGLIYNPDGTPVGIAPKKQDPNNDCTNCQNCVKVCPTHIDIRKGTQLECIHCLECVDACSSVMTKLNKPTLVHWTSTNTMEQKIKPKFLRPKVLAYLVVLGLAFALLIFAGSTRKSMLLNITRTAEAYIVRESGSIDNAYKFLIQNIDKEAHAFSIEVDGVNKDDFEIILPDYRNTKEIPIGAGESKMLVVLLRTKNTHDLQTTDKNIPLTIKVYASDSREKINITNATFFMYPSREVYEQKMQKLSN